MHGWVEVIAPVVFEPCRPRAWPESESLLLDDLPFRVRNPRTGRTLVAFRVFVALGYERGRPKLWRLQAFTSKSPTDWEAFLAALPGAPKRVVCDNDHRLTGAVRALFRDAELYLREWHLRHALERLMVNLRREQPEHREALDELLAGTEAAFTGPSFWLPFTDRLPCRRHPALQRVPEQHRAERRRTSRQRGSKRPAYRPLSTSPLEASPRTDRVTRSSHARTG